MKIIFLVESKFCKRDYERFGIENLLKRGYKDIEVWDLSAWFRPDYSNKYKPKDLIVDENYKSIISKKVAMKLLKLLPSDSLFICIFRPNIKSIAIFNYLNKNKYMYGFLSFGHFPCHSKLSRVRQIINEPILLLEKLVNLILVKIYTLISPPIEANFVLLGGRVATSNYISNKTTLLKAHTLDYDLFLSLRDVSRVGRKKNIVFLDDFGPYHPDDSQRTPISATPYYTMLNNFFENLEVELGMEVVIAPHPRSDYKSIGNPFNRRTISSLSTIQTIKNSDVVISHGSTATSFAVLYNKPMFFMSNNFYPSYSREITNNMANFFQKKPIDISASDFVICGSDFIVDSDVYNLYKELYIKESGTPEKQTWDIFADYLDTI